MHMPSEARELSKFPTVSLARDELPYRLRQQSLLGEFGRVAMQTRDYRQILQRATELCAQGLQAHFAKVLEYQPDERRLMVRAGVGWALDTIDIVSLACRRHWVASRVCVSDGRHGYLQSSGGRNPVSNASASGRSRRQARDQCAHKTRRRGQDILRRVGS